MTLREFSASVTDAVARGLDLVEFLPVHLVKKSDWPIALCGALVRERLGASAAGRDRCAVCLRVAKDQQLGRPGWGSYEGGKVSRFDLNTKTKWGGWAKAVLMQEADLATVADCCAAAALLEDSVEKIIKERDDALAAVRVLTKLNPSTGAEFGD